MVNMTISNTLRWKFCSSWPLTIFLVLPWGHDYVIKWKHFPRNWPFVRGIHRSPVNSTHKGQWRGADVFFDLRPNKRLSKQWWGWWFETLSSPLWRHCNAIWESEGFGCIYVSLQKWELFSRRTCYSTFDVMPIVLVDSTWCRHQMETFPRYWPFVQGIHRSLVNSPRKGQWRGAIDGFFDIRLDIIRHCNEDHWAKRHTNGFWLYTTVGQDRAVIQSSIDLVSLRLELSC